MQNLHPLIQDLALRHHELLKRLLKEQRPEISARISSTWRSPLQQEELFAKGRRLEGGVWKKVGPVVTNAQPKDTPHCHVRKNKDPAALAFDTLLLKDGAILSDRDHAWYLIPACVALIDPNNVLKSGALFQSIRDFPHVEWRNWRDVED